MNLPIYLLHCPVYILKINSTFRWNYKNGNSVLLIYCRYLKGFALNTVMTPLSIIFMVMIYLLKKLITKR